MRFIFDLDGTVIDSSHRQGATLEDWRAMNTRDNIAADGELPLFDHFKDSLDDGLDVIVCTSRVMGEADFEWLDAHGITNCTVICRAEGDERNCGFFKLSSLRDYATSLGMTWGRFVNGCLMFDDSHEVQNTLRSAGLRVVDPVPFNLRLTNGGY